MRVLAVQTAGEWLRARSPSPMPPHSPSRSGFLTAPPRPTDGGSGAGPRRASGAGPPGAVPKTSRSVAWAATGRGRVRPGSGLRSHRSGAHPGVRVRPVAPALGDLMPVPASFPPTQRSHQAVSHRPSHHPSGPASHGDFPVPSLRSTTAPRLPGLLSLTPSPDPRTATTPNLPCLSVLGGRLAFLSPLRQRRVQR